MSSTYSFDRLQKSWNAILKAGIERGLPPSWFGYRWIKKEAVLAYFQRKRYERRSGYYETVHSEQIVSNPLPRNIASRDDLPTDRGWWGFSFWDVPSRVSGETFIATLPNCLIVPYIEPETKEFWVAILNDDERLLDLREIHFKDGHAQTLRSAVSPVRLKQATWVLERVYHNYSHWLTAHLPKFLLLKSQKIFDDVLLSPNRPGFIDRSLRMVGISPERFIPFDPKRPIKVDELTIIRTDRFRPELIRMVQEALPKMTSHRPFRRVFISRAKSFRRRLKNEEEIWPLLKRAGFEKVIMEDLPFEEQVTLMQETAVLLAPHGAGLTNMMFCRPGTHVVEIADLDFPNPNFYALASAMEHQYWVLSAEALGECHPLERDLLVAPADVAGVLDGLNAAN